MSKTNPRAVALLLVLAICVACSRRDTGTSQSEAGQTRNVTDEAGRLVVVPAPIERIVSLAPNLTEIVYAIGAGDRLVGDTTYCSYPPEAKRVAKVGDTLHPSVERIIILRPQLVLVSTASQLEEFTKQLDEHHIAAYVTDPHDLEGVFRSIQNLGDLFGERERAAALVQSLRRRASVVEDAVTSTRPVKVFYQLSAQPLYTAGRDSFVTDLVHRAGGISVTADVPGAWPRYSEESALAAQPEAIILPTGASMSDSNSALAEALKRSPAAIKGRVYKINDDFLARPGPRLVDGLEQIARALHPEAFNQ